MLARPHLKNLPFCDAKLYHIVNTMTCSLLELIEFCKSGSCKPNNEQLFCTQTFNIRLGGGVDDTCNGHYGNMKLEKKFA